MTKMASIQQQQLERTFPAAFVLTNMHVPERLTEPVWKWPKRLTSLGSREPAPGGTSCDGGVDFPLHATSAATSARSNKYYSKINHLCSFSFCSFFTFSSHFEKLRCDFQFWILCIFIFVLFRFKGVCWKNKKNRRRQMFGNERNKKKKMCAAPKKHVLSSCLGWKPPEPPVVETFFPSFTFLEPQLTKWENRRDWVCLFSHVVTVSLNSSDFHEVQLSVRRRFI